ncbi:MAG: hypothetical protein DWP95_10515 [Proteobacteria bacterium]|nr:MAG: hypothetical protein DWP95_10515 [Pseudomonadota bacterium]
MMEILLPIFYSVLFFILLFGVPIQHLVTLLRRDNRIKETYEKPQNYYRLAHIHVVNLIFIWTVLFLAWLYFRDAGSGSFNGIMLAPFLLIYIMLCVLIEKKINKLPRIQKPNH